jgi:hypothetical protein
VASAQQRRGGRERQTERERESAKEGREGERKRATGQVGILRNCASAAAAVGRGVTKAGVAGFKTRACSREMAQRKSHKKSKFGAVAHAI